MTSIWNWLYRRGRETFCSIIYKQIKLNSYLKWGSWHTTFWVCRIMPIDILRYKQNKWETWVGQEVRIQLSSSKTIMFCVYINIITMATTFVAFCEPVCLKSPQWDGCFVQLWDILFTIQFYEMSSNDCHGYVCWVHPIKDTIIVRLYQDVGLNQLNTTKGIDTDQAINWFWFLYSLRLSLSNEHQDQFKLSLKKKLITILSPIPLIINRKERGAGRCSDFKNSTIAHLTDAMFLPNHLSNCLWLLSFV